MKLIDIRIIGYCVLLLGLGCLSGRNHPDNGTFKVWAIHQLESMPQQESYSRADMIDAIKKVASHSWDQASTPPVGVGLIMLVGAILVDVGVRVNKRRSN